MLLLSNACAQRSAPPVADDPERQCWSTDRLLVELGGHRYLTPSLDQSRGFVLATARHDGDMLDLPIHFRTQRSLSLRACQKRARVPLAVSRLSFQMRSDALFQGSPAYNRIELLTVHPRDTDAPFALTLRDTSFSTMAVERLGPQREQPYEFDGASGLTVRCAPRFGESTASPRRWSDCSAFVAVNEATRLWIQFDAKGLSPRSFPRVVAAARDLIASTRR